MEMCFGGTDELQRFLLYLTKSPLSPYHNVSRTNNQLVHHILKAIVNNNSNPGNIQVYYIILAWHIGNWSDFRLGYIVYQKYAISRC